MTKSAQALAAAVHRTLEHDDAERVLAELRKRRKKLREKIAAAAATHIGTTAEDRQFYRDERECEAAIKATAHELIPLRQAHGRRVAEALKAERVAAAEKALAAIAEVETAVTRLNELHEQIRLAGGAAPSVSTKMLGYVRQPLEHIARRQGKGTR